MCSVGLNKNHGLLIHKSQKTHFFKKEEGWKEKEITVTELSNYYNNYPQISCNSKIKL